MDLQDFVTTTLCQISAGVATAKNYDRCVAPRLDVGERDPKILRTFAGADGVFLVEFDVAVTISDASENGATASIMVLSPPAPKPKTKGGIENSSVNRLQVSGHLTRSRTVVLVTISRASRPERSRFKAFVHALTKP